MTKKPKPVASTPVDGLTDDLRNEATVLGAILGAALSAAGPKAADAVVKHLSAVPFEVRVLSVAETATTISWKLEVHNNTTTGAYLRTISLAPAQGALGPVDKRTIDVGAFSTPKPAAAPAYAKEIRPDAHIPATASVQFNLEVSAATVGAKSFVQAIFAYTFLNNPDRQTLPIKLVVLKNS